MFSQTYREFHSDLFPETRGSISGGNVAQWCDGEDPQPQKVSLDPSLRDTPNLQVSYSFFFQLLYTFSGQQVSYIIYIYIYIYILLRDFIFKKTLFEKLQY